MKILNKVIIRYDELKPKYELIIIKSAMEKMADEIVKDLEKLPSVEPEKCGDCISRESALEILDDYAEDIESGNWGTAYSKARTSMCDLPSAEPERKLGKWVHMVGWWECDQCHAEYTDMPTCMGEVMYKYCPMCGTKMEVDG